MCESKKQMLYLSIHGHNQQPYIRFEIEPYYARLKRRIDTEQDIDMFDNRILLRDTELKERLGLWLILCLLVQYKFPDRKDRSWSCVVYPHFRGKQAVLRTDTETYQYMPEREYCGELLLESLDMDLEAENTPYKQTLAERVLTYLPISEELCMQEDTTLLRYHEK